MGRKLVGVQSEGEIAVLVGMKSSRSSEVQGFKKVERERDWTDPSQLPWLAPTPVDFHERRLGTVHSSSHRLEILGEVRVGEGEDR